MKFTSINFNLFLIVTGPPRIINISVSNILLTNPIPYLTYLSWKLIRLLPPVVYRFCLDILKEIQKFNLFKFSYIK